MMPLQEIYKRLLRENQKLRNENERLWVRVTHDSLTGLYNREYLDTRLEEEVEQSVKTGLPLSVLMIDIDYFKKINDTYGHPAGDKVLQQISSILADNTRSHEVAARYGGEEFTVVLPRSNIHKAEVLAERLRTSVKQLTVYGQTITLSIGIAACPEQGSTRDEIINIADQALLEAKALGRDQVRIAGKVKN